MAISLWGQGGGGGDTTLAPGSTFDIELYTSLQCPITPTSAWSGTSNTSAAGLRAQGITSSGRFALSLNYIYYADSTPPTITAPNQTITLEQAKTWAPMDGVKAADDQDGDITGKVTYTPTKPTAMTTTPGTYTFTYTVEDSTGNMATATRTITVLPDTHR